MISVVFSSHHHRCISLNSNLKIIFFRAQTHKPDAHFVSWFLAFSQPNFHEIRPNWSRCWGFHGDVTADALACLLQNSSVSSGAYSLHQLQGNKLHGYEKRGALLKKSEGVRKVWQKRKCSIKDGYLSISHQDVSRRCLLDNRGYAWTFSRGNSQE